MGRRVLLVIALAGCEHVLDLAEVPLPAPDAPYFACARETTPSFVCADFDEADPTVYEGGLATAIQPAAAGATYELRTPAVSAPSALWIDSQSHDYYLQQTGVGAPVSALHASFALQITRAPAYAFEVVEIGMAGAAPGACSVNAQVNAPEPALRMLAICAGARLPAAVALPAIPIGWVHVTLELDTASAIAAMSIDGAPPVTIDLRSQAPMPGLPHVRAGILYEQPTGPQLGLDDLQVTTTP